MNHLNLKFVQGNVAPRYNNTSELTCEEVVITEQGTENKLPIVDFVMTDKNGNKYILVLTGRLVNAISAGIKGANFRNHGVDEP